MFWLCHRCTKSHLIQCMEQPCPNIVTVPQPSAEGPSGRHCWLWSRGASSRVHTLGRYPSNTSICRNTSIPTPQVTRSQGPSHLLVMRSHTHTLGLGNWTSLKNCNDKKWFKIIGFWKFGNIIRWFSVYRVLATLLWGVSPDNVPYCLSRMHFKVPWACSTMVWPVGEWRMPVRCNMPHNCKNWWVFCEI